MNTIRRLMYRPKKTDTSYLAQFYYADEQLNSIAAELDSFDGRKDPERCTALVNQLRHSQDEVLSVVEKIMVVAVPEKSRASRDYRVKFPDDVLHESLAGQLWFGAECLSAGSSIMNREVESASMRPLAKELTSHLDVLRSQLREQCLRNQNKFTDRIIESLIAFDKLFAEFELSYVSAMVPVKTMREYELLQDVTVLFCETVQRALKLGLLTQEMIDMYDPALMFTIPRLAIVSGLLVFPNGPLNPDMDPLSMSEMFRPFQTLLFKIRELLWTLSDAELNLLEKSLSTTDDVERSSSMLAELSGIPPDRCVPVRCQSSITRPDPYADDLSPRLAETSRGLMVHSESTMTVVPGGSPVNGTDSGRTANGTPDFSESTPPLSDLEARRLQHSKSWPQSSEVRRASSAQQSVDGTTSTVAFYGDQQFNFNLPFNTSLDRLEQTRGGGSDEQFVDRGIIYLSSATTGAERNGQRQVTFITDDFCRLFCADTASLNEDDDAGQISRENPTITASNSDTAGENTFVIEQSDDAGVIVTERPSFEVIECDCDTSLNELCGISTSRNFDASSSNAPSLNIVASTAQVTDVHMNNHHSDDEQPPEIPTVNEPTTMPGLSDEKSMDEIKSDDVSRSLPCQRLVQSCDLSHGSAVSDGKSGGNGRRHKSRLPDMTQSWAGGSGVGNLDLSWERASCCSSDTSSYSSDCRDDEEIALAIQAAEMSARQEARSRFKNAADLIHRLFVCISGVADQLQTNYASDLRHILKFVFESSTSESVARLEAAEDDSQSTGSAERQQERAATMDRRSPSSSSTEPPEWLPDDQSPACMACRAAFTFVKRRHHCRNCGKIFCAHCSSNAVPLPHYGHSKPVRVCNRCFVFHVTPFTMTDGSTATGNHLNPVH